MPKLFLENGADVNAKNRFRKTPVFNIIDHEMTEVLKLFIDYSVNFNIRSIGEHKWDDNLTPLQVAEKRGNQEIIELIKNNNANEMS
ncbi:MAG: ankyrin repeat domain-containing protein [bacterium]